MKLPVMPPVLPMLAKSVPEIPAGEFSYEPKWDGFRAIVFRDGDDVEIGSRNTKPMTRYFPELVETFREQLPQRCVLDGEIVVPDPTGVRLDFEALQQRIHPAASRVKLLANTTPARFVAFDILALDDEYLLDSQLVTRREALVNALQDLATPIHLTPATLDLAAATDWFSRFEGAGLDGVIAKPLAGVYAPDKRTMFKIKHERTADCVVAGYRTHKSGDDLIGSLLLGLYADDGRLASVGVIGAFPATQRRELFELLQEFVTDFAGHPWAWAEQEAGVRTPRESETSRWNAGKDLSFTPLRPELVVEVRYDHMEGVRFRHTAQFVRWRPDREPASCTYAQLEEPVSFDLGDVLAGRLPTR
jgi:ATP-dependent DNA ligase